MRNWKKCIAFILAAVFCILTSVTVFAEIDNFINADWDKEFTPGDVNGDGSITTDDLLLVRKYIAGLVSDSEIIFDAADIDVDSLITTDDLVVLRKMIAGLV